MFCPGVTVTSRSAASASSRPGATSAPIRSATDSVRARSMSHSWTRRPRARNVRAAASPFTPTPMTAAVSALDRPSVSAARTAAAPVRSDVTAPASSTALSIPFLASESSTSPVTVGSPCAGFPGNDVTHFNRAWPAPERRHRAKVSFRIRGDIDLRRHRPLAACISDERLAHSLQRTLGRDRRAHLRSAEERNHRDQPPVSPL